METTSELRLRLRGGVPTPLKALSVDEAAATAGICVANLYARVAAGTGPRITKIGARSVVLLVDIEDWILAQREAAPVVKRPVTV